MVTYAREMIQSHPRSAQIDRTSLADCIQACFACADACTICADACLGEGDVQMLIRCIRLCQDCADICDATGRVLGLMPHPERHILPTQHPRWTRDGLAAEGDGLRLFRNAAKYFD